MVKIKTQAVIDVHDWDKLVQDTYGKPYSFQQQDDCKDRGMEYIIVPDPEVEDYENDTVPEEVNGKEMGVSFKAWLARDPNEWNGILGGLSKKFSIDLFWARNFYPHVSVLANDLHAKGLLPAGEYAINIDW